MLFKERDANNAHIKPRWIDLALFEMKKRVMSGAFNGRCMYIHCQAVNSQGLSTARL